MFPGKLGILHGSGRVSNSSIFHTLQIQKLERPEGRSSKNERIEDIGNDAYLVAKWSRP